MKVFRVLTCLCLMLATAAAYGMSVKTDYDRNYDFGRLKTFAFKDQRRPAADPLVADRIRDALRSQLEARGFRYQPDGQPDFLVAFYARAKEKVEVEDVGYGFPHRWRWGFGPTIWTRNYVEGSMIVDFIDPQTNQLIWRGIATDTLHTGPKKSEEQINKGADELVKRFLKETRRKA